MDNKRFYIHAIFRSDEDPEWPQTWHEYRLSRTQDRPDRDKCLFYDDDLDEVRLYLDFHFPGHETTIIDDVQKEKKMTEKIEIEDAEIVDFYYTTDRFNDKTVCVEMVYGGGWHQNFGCVRFGNDKLAELFLEHLTYFFEKKNSFDLYGVKCQVIIVEGFIVGLINTETKEKFTTHGWFIENSPEYRADHIKKIVDGMYGTA